MTKKFDRPIIVKKDGAKLVIANYENVFAPEDENATGTAMVYRFSRRGVRRSKRIRVERTCYKVTGYAEKKIDGTDIKFYLCVSQPLIDLVNEIPYQVPDIIKPCPQRMSKNSIAACGIYDYLEFKTTELLENS